MTYEEMKTLCEKVGFKIIAPLDTGTLEAKPDIREMCNANRCGMYGKTWSCPPALPSVEDCQKKMSGYPQGILLQTKADLEDEFDGEGMQEAHQEHRDQFDELVRTLREQGTDFLPLGAGACRRCRKCTYPVEPCRFLETFYASMEAYGLFVTEVCKKNNVTYYYGKGTITYTGCVLFR